MKFTPKIKVPKKATRRRAIGVPSKAAAPAPIEARRATTTDPFTRKHIVVRDTGGGVLFEGSGPLLRKWWGRRGDAYARGELYGIRPASAAF